MMKITEHNSDEGGSNWRLNIMKKNIHDDDWNVKVIMIEASETEQENMYLKEFEKSCAQGSRFVVKNIGKIETLFMIKQLGGQNNAVPIFMEAQSYIKSNKNVPAETLALIIKHLILTMKEDYLFITKQKLFVKEGLKYESEVMINRHEVKGKIESRGKKSADSSASKHKSNLQKKVNSSIAEVNVDKKYHTGLRMRGEEWRDKEYLEDFPEDGPNLYVTITGFTEPYLPSCLIKIGVPLIAIVKLVIDPKTVRTPSKLSRNIKSDTDFSKKCRRFWEDLQTCRSEYDRDALKNTAMVVFFPTLFNEAINLNDPDVILNNQQKIYDEVCYLMYDLQDLTRQHANFLNNFQVSLIPDEKPNEHLQQQYSRNSTIPLESTTIYIILDYLLQAVTHKMDTLEPISCDENIATKYVVEKNNSLQAETFIDDIFSKLRNNDIAKNKYRVTQKNEFENEQDPIIIHFGDRFRYSTFHLNEHNKHDVVYSMLRGMPIFNLWKYFENPRGENQAHKNFHFNLLSSFFDRKIEVPELTKLIHILNCTNMYNAGDRFVDQNIRNWSTCPGRRLFKRSYLVKPLPQDPLVQTVDFNFLLHRKLLQLSDIKTLYSEESQSENNNFVFDCHNLDVLLNNKINKPNNVIDGFEYFEEFKDVVGLQVLNDAYREFHRCVYNYCPVTDTFTLMFRNRCKNTGLSREVWRGHIATPVCLQDFFEFVFDEKYDWIKNEENLYEKRTKKHATKVAEEKKKMIMSGCRDDTDEFEFIMEGSLKHQDLLDTFLNSETKVSETKDSSMISPKLHSKISILSRLSRRSRMFDPSLASSESIEDSSSQEIFKGYNLSDRRVEALGKESMYFSDDGSIIISKYTSFLHIDSKYLTLNVVVHKNEFWVHRIVGGSPDSEDSSEAFRICTKDMISISVKKQINCTVNKSNNNASNEVTQNTTDADSKRLAGVLTYSLLLAWPNGLITETVHDISKNEISYIKQYFSLPLSAESETQRCISMNGEVIIFKKNGNIDILQPAGAYINISKYEKRTELELDAEQTQYDKINNKEERNHQDANVQTKLPEQKLDDENPSELKNIASELIFHEYKTVDSSGLHQKWTEDVLLGEEKLLSRTATDYCLGEVLTKRSDGTIIFLNKDGDLITTYPNNTKITTSYLIESEDIYPEYSVYELDFNEQVIKKKDELYLSIQIVYTIESPNFTRVTINRSDNSVSIESPNNMFVTITDCNNYEFHFGDKAKAKFNGEYLTINSNCLLKENVCNVNINCNIKDYTTVNNEWLYMKDSFGKEIIVDEEGEISAKEKNISDDDKEEAVVETSFDKWKRLQKVKAVRFFILKRDLSCAELVHRDLVKEYQERYSDTTWSSCKVYKSFSDYRNLLSIVTPMHLTSSERWRMNSKFSNEQRRLVYKDLKHDDGKGFYHWMRPYEKYDHKFIAPVDIVRKSLPKAYVLRTLEQQWDDNNRVCLRNAQELKTALEKYSRALQNNKLHYAKLPLEDFRCDEEIYTDDIFQKVANRFYEDLAKLRVAVGIKLSHPTTITTQPQDTCIRTRDEKDTVELESSHESVASKAERKTEMRPSLKEYWRRRNEEYEEEQRNKYLLREGHVPPYFRNILGGAGWLEEHGS